jgi:hypothetical protein
MEVQLLGYPERGLRSRQGPPEGQILTLSCQARNEVTMAKLVMARPPSWFYTS